MPAPGYQGFDGSGTITTGGTAQLLFGGQTPASGYAIYNPDPATALWVSDSVTAAPNGVGSIYVPPLGGYETPFNYSPAGPVSLVSATTAHKFTARRW